MSNTEQAEIDQIVDSIQVFFKESKSVPEIAKQLGIQDFDPVIVRDGDKGRLIPCVQIASPTEPLADIGFEIISWLFTENIKGDTAVDPAEKLSVVWSDLKTKK